MSSRLIPYLCCSLFFLLLASAIEAASNRKIYLSIGLGKYKDGRWPELRYASKDASDVANYLNKQSHQGQVLNDRTHPSGITRAMILEAIAQVARETTSPDDTVIIYISTHGTLGMGADQGTMKLQKFLVATDTAYDRITDTGVRVNDLIEQFNAIKSRRKALIIDSCYSGGGKAHLTPKILEFLSKQKAGAIREPDDASIEGTGFYAASAWGEEAREDQALENSVYTHFLLKAFESDPNGDGAVHLSEAHATAANWVIDYTQGQQHPSAQVEFVGRDPIVIRGEVRRGALPYIMALQKELRKYALRINGKSVGTLTKGLLEVPEGPSHIELIDPTNGRVIAHRSIELFEHETYTIESLLLERKLNQFNVGMSWIGFLEAEGRNRLFPGRMQATHVSIVREGLYATWDGFAHVIYIPTQSAEVEVDQTLAGGPSFTRVERQELSGWRVDFGMQGQRRLQAWTPEDQAWQTSILYGLGPTWLQLQRSFPDFVTNSNKAEKASSIGAQGHLGLEVFWPIRNLRSGLRGSYALYGNSFTDGPATLGIYSFDASLGLHF